MYPPPQKKIKNKNTKEVKTKRNSYFKYYIHKICLHIYETPCTN